MDQVQSIGGAVHKEEVKLEGFFVTHPVALAVGVAVAAALITLSVVIFLGI